MGKFGAEMDKFSGYNKQIWRYKGQISAKIVLGASSLGAKCMYVKPINLNGFWQKVKKNVLKDICTYILTTAV